MFQLLPFPLIYVAHTSGGDRGNVARVNRDICMSTGAGGCAAETVPPLPMTPEYTLPSTILAPVGGVFCWTDAGIFHGFYQLSV